MGGRGRYERRGEGQQGSPNGYEPGRIRTAEGAIAVQVPQVRGTGEPFRSSLMSFLEGNSEVLERLVAEMVARGLSTRDVEDAFSDAPGELLISKSAVSEITDQLWEDDQAFCSRDLTEIAVEYLFKGRHLRLALRPSGPKRPCSSPGASTPTAEQHLVHLAVGNKESEASLDRVLPPHGLPGAQGPPPR